MRRTHPLFLLLALALALVPAAAPAQTVGGTVADARTGEPVPGAMVRLIDAEGTRHDAALTDARGRYTVRSRTPGRFTVRAERVGYATSAAADLELAPGQQVSHAISMAPSELTLSAVVARGVPRRCTVRPDNGEQAAAVWNEARKALESAELGAQRRTYDFQLRLFRRRLAFPSLMVRDSATWTESGFSLQPFVTPVDRLVSHGYVEPQGDSIVFRAPDAQTLLSDAFLDHHCFGLRVGRDANAALVGLSFAPLRDRRLPDIQGTLWLDRQSGNLRFVEYTYTGLSYTISRGHLGGRIEFAQMPDGGWYVSRWSIRMPVLGVRNEERNPVMNGLIETGGEVLGVTPSPGPVPPRSTP
jgi:hypothetical protein